MRNVSAFPSAGQTAAISAALRSYLVHHQIHDEGKDEKDHDERQEGDADAADLEDVVAAAFGRNPPRLTLAVGPDRSLIRMSIPFNVSHLVPVQFIRLSLPVLEMFECSNIKPIRTLSFPFYHLYLILSLIKVPSG